MAALKFLRGKTAAALPVGKKKPRLKPATLVASGGTPVENAARRKAAAALPGFRGAGAVFGETLAAAATAVLLEQAGESVGVRRRIEGGWQEGESLGREAGAAVIAALKALTAVKPGSTKEGQEGEFVVRLADSSWPCRLTVRMSAKGEQILCVLGGELPARPRQTLGAWFAGFFGRFLPRRKAQAAVDKDLPKVTLDAARGGDPEAAKSRFEQATAAEAYPQACTLVGAAIKARAGEILLECTQQNITVHQQVDGVMRAAETLERAVGDAVFAVLKTIAGLDPKERRKRQSGQCITLIEGKPWPCRIVSQGVPTGERMQVSLDYGRPKFKTFADAGMSAELADRVRHLVALESGLVVIVTPKRGGLSTLFDLVVGSADRMLRDFVVIEDTANPGAEIQNVKPIRWDATQKLSPSGAFEQAMRAYPRAIVSCDVKDAELAMKLVDQAEKGLLVILGIRGEDAVDGLVNLMAFGIKPEALSRTLLGAIGGRLVRKLCPKCHEEYLPSADMIARLRIDSGGTATLRRASPEGCPICAGTGYLGRAGLFEIATGQTLNRYLAKTSDPKVLRQAAAKDGMRPLQQDGIAKAIGGVTSLEEIQRTFKKS